MLTLVNPIVKLVLIKQPLEARLSLHSQPTHNATIRYDLTSEIISNIMADPFSLKSKRALVTGGSSGLGPFIVRHLDAAGASVTVHYHGNKAGAESIAATLENPTEVVQADLKQPDAIVRLFEQSSPIDILINCAATESQDVAELKLLSSDRWRDTQRINVEAPLRLIQKLAAESRPSSVVNISSIEGERPAQGHGHYSASKATLEMLTKSAALEFGQMGIRVNAIAPGLIWRENIDSVWPEGVNAWTEATPLGRLVSPDNIGSAVVFLSSEAAASITGTVLTIDCGLSVKSGW